MQFYHMFALGLESFHLSLCSLWRHGRNKLMELPQVERLRWRSIDRQVCLIHVGSLHSPGMTCVRESHWVLAFLGSR